MFVERDILNRLHIKFAITPSALASLQTQGTIYESPTGFLYGNLFEGETVELYGVMMKECVVVINSLTPIYDKIGFLDMLTNSSYDVFNPKLHDFIRVVGPGELIVGWYYASETSVLTDSEKIRHATLRCQIRHVNARCNEEFVASYFPHFMFVLGILRNEISDSRKLNAVTFFSENSAYNFIHIDVFVTTVDPVYSCLAAGNHSVVDQKKILAALAIAIHHSHEKISTDPDQIPSIAFKLPPPLRFHYFGHFVNALFDGLAKLNDTKAKEFSFPAVNFSDMGFDAQQLTDAPHLYIAARNSVDLELSGRTIYDFMELMHPYDPDLFSDLLKINKAPPTICACNGNHVSLLPISLEAKLDDENRLIKNEEISTEASFSQTKLDISSISDGAKPKKGSSKGKNKESMIEVLQSRTISVMSSISQDVKTEKKSQGEHNEKFAIEVPLSQTKLEISSHSQPVKSRQKWSEKQIKQTVSEAAFAQPKSEVPSVSQEKKKESGTETSVPSTTPHTSSILPRAETNKKSQGNKKKDMELSPSVQVFLDSWDASPIVENKIKKKTKSSLNDSVSRKTSDMYSALEEDTMSSSETQIYPEICSSPSMTEILPEPMKMDISENIQEIRGKRVTKQTKSPQENVTHFASDSPKKDQSRTVEPCKNEFVNLNLKSVNKKQKSKQVSTQKNVKKNHQRENQKSNEVRESLKNPSDVSQKPKPLKNDKGKQTAELKNLVKVKKNIHDQTIQIKDQHRARIFKDSSRQKKIPNCITEENIVESKVCSKLGGADTSQKEKGRRLEETNKQQQNVQLNTVNLQENQNTNSQQLSTSDKLSNSVLNIINYRESRKRQHSELNDKKEQKVELNAMIMMENELSNLQKSDRSDDREETAETKAASNQEIQELHLQHPEFTDGIEQNAEPDTVSIQDKQEPDLQSSNKHVELSNHNLEDDSRLLVPFVIRKIEELEWSDDKNNSQIEENERRSPPDTRAAAEFKSFAFKIQGSDEQLSLTRSSLFGSSSIIAPSGPHSRQSVSDLADFFTATYQLRNQLINRFFSDDNILQAVRNELEPWEETLSLISTPSSNSKLLECDVVQIPTYLRHLEKIHEMAKTITLREIPSLLTFKVCNLLGKLRYQMYMIPSLQIPNPSSYDCLSLRRLLMPEALLQEIRSFRSKKMKIEDEVTSSSGNVKIDDEPENGLWGMSPITDYTLAMEPDKKPRQIRYLEETSWALAIESTSFTKCDPPRSESLEEGSTDQWLENIDPCSPSYCTTSSMVRFCPNPQFFIDDILGTTESKPVPTTTDEQASDDGIPSYQKNDIIYFDSL